MLALHLCEMRNIYARMLLKGGTAEKEGESPTHSLTYSVALAGCMKGMFTPPPRSHPGIIRGTRTTRPHLLVLSMYVGRVLVACGDPLTARYFNDPARSPTSFPNLNLTPLRPRRHVPHVNIRGAPLRARIITHECGPL